MYILVFFVRGGSCFKYIKINITCLRAYIWSFTHLSTEQIVVCTGALFILFFLSIHATFMHADFFSLLHNFSNFFLHIFCENSLAGISNLLRLFRLCNKFFCSVLIIKMPFFFSYQSFLVDLYVCGVFLFEMDFPVYS